mmetsp:Transcript_28663/g.57776  ORF Transcript_28663/g.57776 Transcript_28663/m.57776 type:complete len:88 (-) Transcript_28663:187-450(-)
MDRTTTIGQFDLHTSQAITEDVGDARIDWTALQRLLPTHGDVDPVDWTAFLRQLPKTCCVSCKKLICPTGSFMKEAIRAESTDSLIL